MNSHRNSLWHSIRSQARRLCRLAIVPIVASVVTGAATATEIYVWRARIRLETSTVANAQTDDPITVSLRSGNSRVLDYAQNDFESGHSDYYDLSLDGITTVSDITQIKISKTGSDGWCMKGFTLYLNNTYVTTMSSSGVWLDNSSGHSTTYTKSVSLSLPSQAVPTGMSSIEMKSRVESIVGESIRGFTDTDVDLGHFLFWDLGTRDCDVDVDWDLSAASPITVWGYDGDEAKIHLDLVAAVNVDGIGDFDLDVDVDFRLRFSCSGNEVKIETRYLDVDVDLHGTSVGTDLLVFVASVLGMHLEDEMGDVIQDGMNDELSDMNFPVPACPSISVTPYGDVYFSF